MNPFRSHRRRITLLVLPVLSALLVIVIALTGENAWVITYSDGVGTDGVVTVTTK